VGPGSGLSSFAKTFDSHLYNQEISQLPFIVVNVRSAERQNSEDEIGDPHGLFIYEVHIYYLDMDESWDFGDTRRNYIVGNIEKRQERDVRFGGFQSVDEDCREYVYDSEMTSVTFDSSGQEGDYSFVTELYLRVFTARSKT
jgi:hypothetical protein